MRVGEESFVVDHLGDVVLEVGLVKQDYLLVQGDGLLQPGNIPLVLGIGLSEGVPFPLEGFPLGHPLLLLFGQLLLPLLKVLLGLSHQIIQLLHLHKHSVEFLQRPTELLDQQRDLPLGSTFVLQQLGFVVVDDQSHIFNTCLKSETRLLELADAKLIVLDDRLQGGVFLGVGGLLGAAVEKLDFLLHHVPLVS